MFRSARTAAALLASLAVATTAWKSASACSRPAPLEHVIDPALAEVDRSPPSAPGNFSVETARRQGMSCNGSACVANSCGDSAFISITFTPAIDDQSAPERIGYRLDRVDGELITLAPSVQPAPAGSLFYLVNFDAIVSLDAVVTMTAIDAAGNESETSEPFDLTFSGCTRPPAGENCLENAGCNLSSVTGSGSGVGAALVGLGLALLGLRNKR